jgi:DNA processing protein
LILKEIPNELKDIKPEVKNLNYKGNLSLLKKDKIAIVGTRKPSQYTKEMVLRLSSSLSSKGVVVVSGAALGVDAVAHRGANGNTIAVMANSLDIKYPKINSNLIESIYQNGLALSEYEESTKATKYSFVLRNRIVVALSRALVIAQADLNSGSLRSAEYAIKYGIPIYVLPHRLNESLGTSMLLKEKKTQLIYDIDEFVNDFTKESIQISKQNSPISKIDIFLEYCKNSNPTYEEAMIYDANSLFEAELEGKIAILNSKIVLL